MSEQLPIERDELAVFFETLAGIAAAETLPHFRKLTGISNKFASGFDPVTEADRNAETALRHAIEKRFPDHGIIGEEHDNTRESARWQWIIDPIDGTRAFISGLPGWGTLIGLYCDGAPIAGLLGQPWTGELFWGFSGDAPEAFTSRNGDVLELKTSRCDTLSAATMMTTSPRIFSPADLASYDRLEAAVQLPRYGFDCYAYAMLAAGHVDIVAECDLNIYDIAALIPIIEGAGGVVTSWTGGPAAQGGSVLASANQTLHEQALAVLAGD